MSELSKMELVASIDDLLVEILLRLPLRPMFQFKTVAKRWNSLISDPEFSGSHIREQRNNPTAGVIFQSRVATKFLLDLNLPPLTMFVAYSVSFDKSTTNRNASRITPLDQLTNLWPSSSCNGLLLCGFHDSMYYVCNPTTHKSFRLPRLDCRKDRKLAGACLAFDPSKSPHYSVVCVWILEPYNEHMYEFEVYSSEMDCWKKCGEPFMASADFKRGVYWNGSIHWINRSSGKSIYFDPDGDHQTPPKVMPSLPLYDTPSSFRMAWYYFGESGGHLNYIDDCYDVLSMEFTVHEMRRDYSEWFVKYKVNLSTIGHNSFAVWALVRCKKDEDSFLVFWKERTLVRYNIAYKTIETICDCETDLSTRPWDVPLQYIESPCPVQFYK